MKRTFWALLLLAILVIGYLGVGLVVAARLSAPSHHPQELTPTDVGLNYRQVSLEHRRARACRLVGTWE